jgi:hypothetical protein
MKRAPVSWRLSVTVAERSAFDWVRISTPSRVTAIVCSNWADSEWSRVMTVHPSPSTFDAAPPMLIIGSMVKVMPSRSSRPVPGLP